MQSVSIQVSLRYRSSDFFPNYDFAFAFFRELCASHKAVVYKGLDMRYVCYIQELREFEKDCKQVVGEVSIITA